MAPLGGGRAARGRQRGRGAEAPAPGQSPRVDAIRKVGELRVGVLQNAPWLIQDVSGKTGEAWSGPAWLLARVCAAPGREADAGARVA